MKAKKTNTMAEKLTPYHVKKIVAEVCETTFSNSVSKTKRKNEVIPRHIVYYLCNKYCYLQPWQMRLLFHQVSGTIYSGIRNITNLKDTNDKLYSSLIKQCESKLNHYFPNNFPKNLVGFVKHYKVKDIKKIFVRGHNKNHGDQIIQIKHPSLIQYFIESMNKSQEK